METVSVSPLQGGKATLAVSSGGDVEAFGEKRIKAAIPGVGG